MPQLSSPEPGVRMFRFPASARRVFRVPPKIAPSQWQERHQRHVPISSQPGPWRNENAPYLAGIMDAVAHYSVREADVCAPPQTGKTEVNFSLLCFYLDVDPGPAMMVMQTDTEARETSRDRLRPMLEKTPRLARHLTGDAKDAGALRIPLRGMPLYLAWGTSVSRAASKPIKYLFVDEEDKYPASHRTETNPVRLLFKRVRRFPRHKIVRTCSPTMETVGIWQALMVCPVVFKYFVRCPACGRYQVMRFKQVKVPENMRDPETIKHRKLAWYECEACGDKWNDFRRDEAVRRGKWMTDDEVDLFDHLAAVNPQRIGFHYSALISSFVSLSEVMGVWFEAQGDRNALRDFFNGYLAEPWLDYQVARQEEDILRLCDDRPRDLVPGYVDGRGQVAALMLTADTQDNGLYYVVRAFGYGEERESWQVRMGFLALPARHEMVRREGVMSPDFRQLERILAHEFKDGDGRSYWIQRALIDSQGHRTHEVYAFCKKHLGLVWPFRGSPQPQQRPLMVRQVDMDKYRGLSRLDVDSNYFKNVLAGKLEVNPADPGAFHLGCRVETQGEYPKHMTAEFINDKGLWECPDHRPNHYWDCEYMGFALWEFVEGALLQNPADEHPAPRAQQTDQEEATAPGAMPSWFERM